MSKQKKQKKKRNRLGWEEVSEPKRVCGKEQTVEQRKYRKERKRCSRRQEKTGGTKIVEKESIAERKS